MGSVWLLATTATTCQKPGSAKRPVCSQSTKIEKNHHKILKNQKIWLLKIAHFYPE